MIERASQIATSMSTQPGALLPVLHAVQDELGYIPPETVPAIAAALNLSRAEVHGVISFYHLLRSTPPGEKTVYICRAEGRPRLPGACVLPGELRLFAVGDD
jgi:formate dehydrogenase subunit gamma